MNEMKLSRKSLTVITAVLLLLVLTACFSSEQESEEVRIHLFDQGSSLYFESLYNIFEYEHPGITVDVSQDLNGVRAGDLEYEQLLYMPDPPDVFILNYREFYELMNKQLLLPLDGFLAQNGWEETDFVPGILDSLRRDADQQLYGLTTQFNGRVLLFNKTLFDQAEVPYPTEGITWEEVFAYAKQLTQDDPDERIFGLHWHWHADFPRLKNWLTYYAPPLEMKLFEDGEMTVETEEWKQLWEDLVSMAQEDVFPFVGHIQEPDSYNSSLNLFLDGKLAMTTATYGNLQYINEMNESAHLLSDYDPIDWEIVSLPRHEDNPEVVGGLMLGDVIAVSAQSPNAQEAWQLVEFLLNEGDRDVEVMGGPIPILQASADQLEISAQSSAHISVFYPKNFVLIPHYEPLFVWDPDGRYDRILAEGDRQLGHVLKGEKTIEAALSDWQRGGNSILR